MNSSYSRKTETCSVKTETSFIKIPEGAQKHVCDNANETFAVRIATRLSSAQKIEIHHATAPKLIAKILTGANRNRAPIMRNTRTKGSSFRKPNTVCHRISYPDPADKFPKHLRVRYSSNFYVPLQVLF